jgi:hypothetical protein
MCCARIYLFGLAGLGREKFEPETARSTKVQSSFLLRDQARQLLVLRRGIEKVLRYFLEIIISRKSETCTAAAS